MHVLLVKTSSLGDVVHNLPVVTDIQRHRPDAVIDWLVEETFADIPHLHPGVHRVIPVAVRRWRKRLFAAQTWREIQQFRRMLCEQRYDVVLDTQGLLKSAVLARQADLTEGGRRLGYAAEAAREPLAARCYDVGFAIPRNAHAIERNRWLAAAAFDYRLDTSLDYGIVATQFAADWLPAGGYAVFLTGTSRADKLWPEPDWVALSKALNMPVILPSGSAEESARAQRLAAQMPQAVAAPKLGIKELAGLLMGAQIVIGLDTGLTHLATALGRPTVALFTGSDPTLTGVLAGAGSHDRAINLGRAGVPPQAEEVIAVARDLLQ